MSDTTASDGTGSRDKINYEEQDLIDTFMGREHTRWAPGHYESGYHNDWNYLMPVVEKIEAINIDDLHFKIEFCACDLSYHGFGIRHFEGADKQDAVYTAVVTFIKWFNNQKQQAS